MSTLHMPVSNMLIGRCGAAFLPVCGGAALLFIDIVFIQISQRAERGGLGLGSAYTSIAYRDVSQFVSIVQNVVAYAHRSSVHTTHLRRVELEVEMRGT